jgi:hypothetical protein
MNYERTDIIFKNDRAEVALVEDNTFYIKPVGFTVVTEGHRILSITDDTGDKGSVFISTLAKLGVPLKLFKNGKKAVKKIQEVREEAQEVQEVQEEPKTKKRRKRRKKSEE